MNIIKCDVCDTEIRGNTSLSDMVLSFGGKKYEHICSHCAGKIEPVVKDIENRPGCVCQACGNVSR